MPKKDKIGSTDDLYIVLFTNDGTNQSFVYPELVNHDQVLILDRVFRYISGYSEINISFTKVVL